MAEWCRSSFLPSGGAEKWFDVSGYKMGLLIMIGVLPMHPISIILIILGLCNDRAGGFFKIGRYISGIYRCIGTLYLPCRLELYFMPVMPRSAVAACVFHFIQRLIPVARTGYYHCYPYCYYGWSRCRMKENMPHGKYAERILSYSFLYRAWQYAAGACSARGLSGAIAYGEHIGSWFRRFDSSRRAL